MPEVACGAPRRTGFTLLEAVVALAIFAAAGIALYALFSNNLFALTRIDESQRQVAAVRQAVERLSGVNPWHEREGRFSIGDLEVVWAAQPVEPPRNGMTSFGELGAFDVGLFDVQFDILEPFGNGPAGDESALPGRRLGRWQLRLVGFDLVRPPLPPMG
jgi:general secretion pathway protein I